MANVSPISEHATTARYRAAIEGRDIDGVIAVLAPHAVVRPAISDSVVFRGSDDIRGLLPAVFASVANIRFFADVGDNATRALFYRATVGGQAVEEATRVQLNGAGLIEELTLFFRPLPG